MATKLNPIVFTENDVLLVSNVLQQKRRSCPCLNEDIKGLKIKFLSKSMQDITDSFTNNGNSATDVDASDHLQGLTLRPAKSLQDFKSNAEKETEKLKFYDSSTILSQSYGGISNLKFPVPNRTRSSSLFPSSPVSKKSSIFRKFHRHKEQDPQNIMERYISKGHSHEQNGYQSNMTSLQSSHEGTKDFFLLENPNLEIARDSFANKRQSTPNLKLNFKLNKNDLERAKSFNFQISPLLTPKLTRTRLKTVEEKLNVFDEILTHIRENNCKQLKSILKKENIEFNKLSNTKSYLHEAIYKGCTRCIKLLLKNGCNANEKDRNGWTPLHIAVFTENLDTVKHIIALDQVFVNITNNEGLTPLHLAVRKESLYITHELMRHGADPLYTTEKKIITPFQMSIDYKKTLILDYFILLECFLVK